MAKIFISYSSEDSIVVTDLYNKLQEKSVDCWLAPENIKPGQEWEEKIVEAIESCQIMICVVSVNSNKSDHVKREVSLAAEKKMMIIPVLISSVKPEGGIKYYFHRLHQYDYSKESKDFEKLIVDVQALLEFNNSKSKHKVRVGRFSPVVDLKNTGGYVHAVDNKELEVAETFQNCMESFDKALTILHEKRILLLSGEKSSGRYMLALNLLNNLKSEKFFKLYPEVETKKLDSYLTKKSAGYILEDVSCVEGASGTSTFRMNLAQIQKIAQTLEDLNSYFVIITDFCSFDFEIDKFSINHTLTAQERNKILKQQIENNFSGHEIERLNEELINDKFKILVGEYLQLREIPLLIEEMRKYLNGKIETEVVYGLFIKKSENEIRAWFKQVSSINDAIFAIVLAVLNDMPSELINEQTSVLYDLVCETYTEVESEKRLQLNRNQADLLEQLQAKEYTDYWDTEMGRTPVHCTGFLKTSLAETVFKYAWQSYYQLHEPVLAWINQMGELKNRQMIDAATKAAAMLSQVDFLVIKEKLIDYWAAHQKEKMRFNAVRALSYVSENNSQIPLCLRLIHYWAFSGNRCQTWTAAWSYYYISDLGAANIVKVLEDLKSIIEYSDVTVLEPISNILHNIFAYGETDNTYFKMVLQWFNDCLNFKDEDTRFLVLLIFWLIALEPASEYSKLSNVPLMVQMLGNKEMRKKHIEVILVHGIRLNPLMRDYMEEILEGWLVFVNDHPELQPGVRNLFLELIANSKPFECIIVSNLLKRMRKKNRCAENIVKIIYEGE